MSNEPATNSTPHWAVTFADLMALLLTFTLMLISFSELKSEEKYEALMDTFQEQFGYRDARASLRPGELRPRNSALSKMASAGRSRRQDATLRASQVQLPSRDSVLITLSAHRSKPVLYFQQEEIGLNDNQQVVLQQLVDDVLNDTSRTAHKQIRTNRVAGLR